MREVIASAVVFLVIVVVTVRAARRRKWSAGRAIAMAAVTVGGVCAYVAVMELLHALPFG